MCANNFCLNVKYIRIFSIRSIDFRKKIQTWIKYDRWNVSKILYGFESEKEQKKNDQKDKEIEKREWNGECIWINQHFFYCDITVWKCQQQEI